MTASLLIAGVIISMVKAGNLSNLLTGRGETFFFNVVGCWTEDREENHTHTRPKDDCFAGWVHVVSCKA